MNKVLFFMCSFLLLRGIFAKEEISNAVDIDIGSSREALRTDDELTKREEEAIKLDELNVTQRKEIRESAEKHLFQAEVNRMMKLIIHSLYRNKEIFLREIISNASDALDKIRVLALTSDTALHATNELSIRIKIDKNNRIIHVTDTGIGMTKAELVNNLGTIAKSGTSDFFNKMQNSNITSQQRSDLIGQFGVGFYSSFLVADRVEVTSKHNDDKQYIWESDAVSFSVMEDPNGATLKRGTRVSLFLKQDAYEYEDRENVKKLIKKYSQFINFPIYLWNSKEVEEEVVEDNDEDVESGENKEDELDVEDEYSERKTIKKTKVTDDWELLNSNKPIWTRPPSLITEEEYDEFYKALTRDTKKPLAKSHFTAEGEVTFKALLFVPQSQPEDSFNNYGKHTDNIKLYVRRVFITEDFNDLLPNYIRFIKGVVDSDDLPLNVSRETLQQHKLIQLIKKKLIRKAIDMMLQLSDDNYMKFWKEYSTNIKLGIIEDSVNRAKLAKLLMFHSSHSKKMTKLTDYVKRAKPDQDQIYYIAGATREQLETSPFVEGLLNFGYEVLYLIEAVDEYCVSRLPEFGMKRFQNIAKEDFIMPSHDGENEAEWEKTIEEYKPLISWLENDALEGKIQRAVLSQRLLQSPCALLASVFGYTGNMERLAISSPHRKTNDETKAKINTKKILELNPRHPIIWDLLLRINENVDDSVARRMTLTLFRLASLKSGYILDDTSDFVRNVETMMMSTLHPTSYKSNCNKEIDPLSTEDGNGHQHEEL